MPAAKLRIPAEDAPKYGEGNLSQLAKARLLEALANIDTWPTPFEPSSALPATAVSVWLTAEQIEALAHLTDRHKIPGVEPMATALLHGWAKLRAAPQPVAETLSQASGADVFLPIDDVDLPSRHSPRSISDDLARKERAATNAASTPAEDLPWSSAVEEGAAPIEPASAASGDRARGGNQRKAPSRAVVTTAPTPASQPVSVAPLQALPAVTSDIGTLDAINSAFGDDTRQAQAVFFSRIKGELSNRNAHAPAIAAEAATGIGKTRVFLATMLDWTREHPTETAVLTAPSYNVLLQAVRLWRSLRALLPQRIPDAVTLLGQQEFASEWAIERVLGSLQSDADGVQEVRDWMAAGGPAPADDPLQHRWLMRGLLAATDGRWAFAAQSKLDSDAPENDPGRRSYESQFAAAKDVPWVFCTHAMLATEVRRRVIQTRSGYKDEHGVSVSSQQWAEWQARDAEERKGKLFWQEQNDLLRSLADADPGRLPAIGLLVVDEAHLLEENFARVFSTGTSIASLMRTLRQLRDAYPAQFKAAEVKEISGIWEALKAAGAAHIGESVAAADMAAASRAISQVRKLLAGILKRRHVVDGQHGHLLRQLRVISRSLEIAAQSNGDRAGMTTRISWSPSAHWPSIEVGRYDVSSELDFLWTCMVQDRSILVSATLFDDVAQSGIVGLQRLLALRSDRLKPLEPVRPLWTTEPVTLYLPAETVITDGNREQAPFYRPWPKHCKDQAQLQSWWARWREQLAQYVQVAYEAGEGGMLVLLTSHQEREALAAHLEAHLPSGTLVSQEEGMALDAVKHRYLAALARGQRPIMLAVGAAWTGLDLSGDALAALIGRPVPTNEDNVLTDLVIANAPIGANRTLTQQSRRERDRSADFSATTMLLRQGIGRLVRREGLARRSRRLHFLDARIYDAAWNAYFNPIRRVLAPYVSRRSIV